MKSKLSAKLLVVVIAVIVSIGLAHYNDFLPARWETYVAPDHSFSIELPGKPRERTTQMPLDNGMAAIRHGVSANPNRNALYSCDYFEIEHLGDKPSEQILDAGRDGMLRKTLGTIRTQRPITVQGYPGLEMQVSAPNNSLIDARLVLVGKRFYTILVVASDKGTDAKGVRRMFESFKVQ